MLTVFYHSVYIELRHFLELGGWSHLNCVRFVFLEMFLFCKGFSFSLLIIIFQNSLEPIKDDPLDSYEQQNEEPVELLKASAKKYSKCVHLKTYCWLKYVGWYYSFKKKITIKFSV